MSIEAMKLALEALEGFIPYLPLPDKTQCGRYDKAIAALRAAIEQAQANDFNPDWDAMAVMVTEQQRMAKRIAELETQPEQEPVAWMWADGTITNDPDRADGTWKPLYTAPRQWQGLTDDEAIDLLPVGDWDIESTLEFAKAIEAKLKEKNNA